MGAHAVARAPFRAARAARARASVDRAFERANGRKTPFSFTRVALARVGPPRARVRPARPRESLPGHFSLARVDPRRRRRHALDARENVRRGVRAVVHAPVRADDGVVGDDDDDDDARGGTVGRATNLEARGRVVRDAAENRRRRVARDATGRESDARARSDDFGTSARDDVERVARGERGRGETRGARREDDGGGADARVESQRRGDGRVEALVDDE